VQVEWKWCGGFSRNNFKHKLHMVYNLWEGQNSPPYSILCAFSWGLHPSVTFPLDSRDSQVGVPKLGLSLSQNFGHLYLSQIKSILRAQGQYLITLENIF
jgi:hypothetical protein